MDDLDPLIQAVLICGDDDWVMAADIVSIIITTEHIPHTETEIIKNDALKIIREVTLNGLMIFGDVKKDGFYKWDLPIEDALLLVENKWNSLGRNPSLGEVCWLCNTEKGDKQAREFIEKKPPE